MSGSHTGRRAIRKRLIDSTVPEELMANASPISVIFHALVRAKWVLAIGAVAGLLLGVILVSGGSPPRYEETLRLDILPRFQDADGIYADFQATWRRSPLWLEIPASVTYDNQTRSAFIVLSSDRPDNPDFSKYATELREVIEQFKAWKQVSYDTGLEALQSLDWPSINAESSNYAVQYAHETKLRLAELPDLFALSVQTPAAQVSTGRSPWVAIVVATVLGLLLAALLVLSHAIWRSSAQKVAP